MALGHCPSQEHCSFVFAANIEQVFLLIIILILLIFIMNKIPLFTILLFITNVVIASVVTTVSVLFLFIPSLLYSFHMVLDLFHVSDIKHFIVYFSYVSVSCNILWGNMLHIVAGLIHFKFRNFMNFDTDRLYITSLFNSDRILNWIGLTWWLPQFYLYSACSRLVADNRRFLMKIWKTSE